MKYLSTNVLSVANNKININFKLNVIGCKGGVEFKRFYFHLFVGMKSHATSRQSRCVGCLASYHMQGYRGKPVLERLGSVLHKTSTPCYGWALIATHFHLFLKTGKKSIAQIMRRLLTRKQKNGEALLKKLLITSPLLTKGL